MTWTPKHQNDGVLHFRRVGITRYTYLLTYSMEQSPSWEANNFSASQEISRIYGTRRFITPFTSARRDESLSPRHGAFSGFRWKNGLQYGG